MDDGDTAASINTFRGENLVEKHGCPSCRDLADMLASEGEHLIQNGESLVSMGSTSEGRSRIMAGMALQSVAESIAMQSANTFISALTVELDNLRLRIEQILQNKIESSNNNGK